MTALYIVLIVLAVIMLLLLVPADCVIDFSYNNDENKGNIIVKYFFLKFKILPADKKVKEAEKEIEEKEKPTEKKNNTAGLIQLAKAVYEELKEDILRVTGHFFKRTIRIKELNISAKFGIGDPMYTGIAAGGVNAAVYNAVSFIDRHMTLDKWNVSLDADFDNACLAAGVYMKIRTRILFALKLGMMVAVLLLKIQRINRRINKNG